jgi:hypothetical protein
MADESVLSLLQSGAAEWNRWRVTAPKATVDLSSAVLTGADLRGFNLQSANLVRAILRGARLEGADLSNADLSFANLESASLLDAIVNGASFLGANLTGANIGGVDFSNAKTVGAVFDERTVRYEPARYVPETRQEGEAGEAARLEPWIPSGARVGSWGVADYRHESSEDFAIVFDPDLTPEQVRQTLSALAEYYRACGGLGLKIEFQLQETTAEELVPAR